MTGYLMKLVDLEGVVHTGILDGFGGGQRVGVGAVVVEVFGGCRPWGRHRRRAWGTSRR